MSEKQKPQRRFRLEITMDADSMDELKSAFDNAEFSIFAEHRVQSVSGGCTSGYYFRLTENPEMTHEAYTEAADPTRTAEPGGAQTPTRPQVQSKDRHEHQSKI